MIDFLTWLWEEHTLATCIMVFMFCWIPFASR